MTVIPRSAAPAQLDDVPVPGAELGSVVVETLAVGVCGTDVEIAGGQYRWAPAGRERLILGHESLGRVIDPGPSGFAAGDHVVGIVRRPDPAPCPNCAIGEWDMCTNGGYTERVINQVDGFRDGAGREGVIAADALATTVVGSSRTPRTAKRSSTFTAYSGSIGQRSAMKDDNMRSRVRLLGPFQ